MKTLASLRERLLALPGIREGRALEVRYAVLLKRTAASREQVDSGVKASVHAKAVLPAPGYAEALRRITRAATGAKKLKADLDADPKKILEDAVEKRFTVMGEDASASWARCLQAWQDEISAKIRDWELLSDVIRRVFATGGAELGSAVQELKKIKIPEAAAEAEKAKTSLDRLSKIVGRLDLGTEFGKFLKSVATSQGAGLADAQKPEVKAIIGKHKIEHVFRVKLI